MGPYRTIRSSVLLSCLGSSFYRVLGSSFDCGSLFDFEFTHDGPHEADELASDSEDVATSTVACLSDRSPSRPLARGVLPGHEAEIGHELAGPLEATSVTDLSDEGHSRECADAPEAGQPLDLDSVGITERDLFDLTIELITATELVVHERQVLAIHGPVLGCETLLMQEPLEPCSMLRPPASSVAEDEATPTEELHDVVARAKEFALKRLTTPNQVPDALGGR